MIKKYDKLVRDNIPNLIAESGKIFGVTSATGEELYNYRKKKVLEEIEELKEQVVNSEDTDKCIEELVDVIETIWYYLYGYKFTQEDAKELFLKAFGKREINGAFDKNIILKEVRDEGDLRNE